MNEYIILFIGLIFIGIVFIGFCFYKKSQIFQNEIFCGFSFCVSICAFIFALNVLFLSEITTSTNIAVGEVNGHYIVTDGDKTIKDTDIGIEYTNGIGEYQLRTEVRKTLLGFPSSTEYTLIDPTPFTELQK